MCTSHNKAVSWTFSKLSCCSAVISEFASLLAKQCFVKSLILSRVV